MGRKFITDLGYSPVLTNAETGETTTLARYGVWSAPTSKANVIIVGDDLEALQTEHGPNLPVFPLGAQESPPRP